MKKSTQFAQTLIHSKKKATCRCYGHRSTRARLTPCVSELENKNGNPHYSTDPPNEMVVQGYKFICQSVREIQTKTFPLRLCSFVKLFIDNGIFDCESGPP